MNTPQSVFQYDSYKLVMAAFLTGAGKRGQLSRAADTLRCQRSYLSRVISENLHLTPEHAFNLAKFLGFNESERNYFIALVERDRAAGPEYRSHWERQIKDLRKKNESISERTNRQALAINTNEATYFTSWTWTAIHFLTAVPGYQTTKKIAERLHLSESFVGLHLAQLAEQGLVERKGEKWQFTSGEFHASAGSPLALLHHQNWRGRAVLDAQDISNGHLHFTGVHTLSRKDSEKIKSLLLDFIAEANRIAGPSDPEDCVALVCDLFPV